jgi:hypothetical protein
MLPTIVIISADLEDAVSESKKIGQADRHGSVWSVRHERRQYVAPLLTQWGRVEDLTAGAGATDHDGGGSSAADGSAT